MWKLKLLSMGRWVGGFFSAKALSIALTGALVAGGAYVLHALKDRGVLEERLAQAGRDLAQSKADNKAWQEHADAIYALTKKIDTFDQELRTAREDRAALARVVDGRISELRSAIPEVQDFLARPAPAALVRVLCDDATIDPHSADCAALDTGEVSHGL